MKLFLYFYFGSLHHYFYILSVYFSSSAVRTVKSEIRHQRRLSGGDNTENGTETSNMTAAERRAYEAEKRAEWRKARYATFIKQTFLNRNIRHRR